MTDFQMSLIAAGGVFVVGVISYNKWHEYKARKSVERAFASSHDDVLMRSGEQPVVRQEPVFDVSAAPVADGALAPSTVGASALAAAQEEIAASLPGATPGTPPAEVAESLVDPLIDCMIPLALEAAARGDKILPVL